MGYGGEIMIALGYSDLKHLQFSVERYQLEKQLCPNKVSLSMNKGSMLHYLLYHGDAYHDLAEFYRDHLTALPKVAYLGVKEHDIQHIRETAQKYLSKQDDSCYSKEINWECPSPCGLYRARARADVLQRDGDIITIKDYKTHSEPYMDDDDYTAMRAVSNFHYDLQAAYYLRTCKDYLQIDQATPAYAYIVWFSMKTGQIKEQRLSNKWIQSGLKKLERADANISDYCMENELCSFQITEQLPDFIRGDELSYWPSKEPETEMVDTSDVEF